MKKSIIGFLFAICSLFCQAQNTGYVYGVAWYGPTANQLRFITTGPNISVYNDIFDAIPADWNASSGQPGAIANKPDLSTKFNVPTCPITQYLRGDGSCAAFPASATINRAIVTTASDGTYTWTFPTACSGTAVVQVTAQNNVSGEVINHKLTAVSSTSATVATSRAVLTLNGLLGLTIPIIQTASAQTLHLTAICP